MKLTLINKKNLEDDIYLFTFRPEVSLMWRAGQQMVFTLASGNHDNLGNSRTLSIASAPFEKNVMVLTHCGEQASTFKTMLRQMGEGDEIEGDDPFGAFVIREPKKDYTLIAAGVGIAPFRSILMDLDYHNQPMNVMLFYSHVSEKFPFKKDIEELLERHANFKVFYTIDPTEVERGRIKEVLVGMADHPIYMSGIYVRKIATMLDYRDVSPRRTVHDGRGTELTRHQVKIQKDELCLASMWGE
jgi:ferredoxin-NADP reductase